MKGFCLSCGLLLFLPLTTYANYDPDTELARATLNAFARNPYDKYYSLPFVNDFNLGEGAGHNTQSILSFKPIVPFQLSNRYDLISRSIFPIFYHQPGSNPRQGYINGYGDINTTLFLSPGYYHTMLWGAGPTLTIPTSTNQAFGSGKWSVGPEAAYFYMPDKWTLGFLASNIWSVAGDPSRSAVNQFSFQYFISYNFPHGWFLTSQPTIMANWKAASQQKWLVPFGIGGGVARYFNGMGAAFSLQAYYNAIHPASVGPDWNVQAKVEVLFEDKSVVHS
jgi:hypothetical protein